MQRILFLIIFIVILLVKDNKVNSVKFDIETEFVEFVNKKYNYKFKIPKNWIICDGTEYYKDGLSDIKMSDYEELVKNCNAFYDNTLPYIDILLFPQM